MKQYRAETTYKYDEDRYIEDVRAHIDATYVGHYVGRDNVQALDLVFATDNGRGFCIGSALKYVARYGKKGGYNKSDLLKAAHYIVLLMHLHDSVSDNK